MPMTNVMSNIGMTMLGKNLTLKRFHLLDPTKVTKLNSPTKHTRTSVVFDKGHINTTLVYTDVVEVSIVVYMACKFPVNDLYLHIKTFTCMFILLLCIINFFI